MRDYYYHPDGVDPGIPVAELPTRKIQDLLHDGFDANGEATVEAIIERLKLELFIREEGLRNV